MHLIHEEIAYLREVNSSKKILNKKYIGIGPSFEPT